METTSDTIESSIEITPEGGKHSYIGKALHLVPPKAILMIAGILFIGAKKYGVDNWRNISIKENINHAIHHLYLFLDDDKSENHLGNAACRVLFALELWLCQKKK